MFQNAALDIATALALMYLVLSLACTVVNEYVATKLKLRSSSLEAALLAILDHEGIRTRFYAHGLIAGPRRAVSGANGLRLHLWPTLQLWLRSKPETMAKPATDKSTPTASEPDNHPSYISTDTFVLALVSSLGAPHVPKDKLIPEFADVQAGIKALPDCTLKAALIAHLTVAQGDFERFRKGVATWFDDAMDHLSGSYKRNLKLVSIVVGCLVATLLNADTFTVARTLWSDATLRAQMVRIADATVAAAAKTDSQTMSGNQSAPANSTAGGRAATVDADANAKPTGTASEAAAPSVKDVREALTTADAELRPLPIGWSGKTLPDAWVDWLLKGFGLFVTGLALSLGAPFWFDALSSFMNLRATGVKPVRQK